MNRTAKCLSRLLIPAIFLAAFSISGCASTSNYGDPQLEGKIPAAAEHWGVGTVSNGAKLTLGGKVNQAGSFYLVAGDQLILERTVVAGDNVWADIDHSLLGGCHVHLHLNNDVVGEANTDIAVYHAYFLKS